LNGRFRQSSSALWPSPSLRRHQSGPGLARPLLARPPRARHFPSNAQKILPTRTQGAATPPAMAPPKDGDLRSFFGRSSAAPSSGATAQRASATPPTAAANRKRGRDDETMNSDSHTVGAPASRPRVDNEGATSSAAGASASRPPIASRAPPKAPTPPSTGKKKRSAPSTLWEDEENGPAAVAAREAAAAALGPRDLGPDVPHTVLPEAPGGYVPHDTTPSNPGSKVVPEGHPDALKGITFVLTGTLESLSREAATDLIRSHGGRIVGSVSTKTTYVVVGKDCGRSKFVKIAELGTPLLSEDGLIALVAATTPLRPRPTERLGGATGAARARDIMATAMGDSPARGSAATRLAPAATAGRGPVELWVTKHAPRSTRDLCGNPSAIASLVAFLTQWEDVHLRGKAFQPPSAGGRGAQVKEWNTRRAVLLSGPPGIGKTSAAHTVARQLGLRVVEVNASDTRGKSDSGLKIRQGVGGKLANVVRDFTTNRTLGALWGGRQSGAASTEASGGAVLIMDEVDGMSAGDRGGVADLILTIKNSRVPIVCICNDKYSQKLKSLRSHVVELEFRRPTLAQLRHRLGEICQSEGLRVNEQTLGALVESTRGDVRAVLGQLQMLRLRGPGTVSWRDVAGEGGAGVVSAKDENLTPFSAADALLAHSAAPLPRLAARIDLVFQDLDLVPLLIQAGGVSDGRDR